MFLKSLEIRGFKSFADSTELLFDKGITTIVGPNGSGKSNISDAVKWVLGEQSIKRLRGSKMEDVIFAGTQYRKPVGVAQVALTLQNKDKSLPIDYSYVTIKRRIYKSGESGYYINNTKCRLKDIQELFMDTGIGKEGYSIIGQGKIDAILSGKQEDKRNLLEEAAGIVKYKTRKEEAERKLESTENNLIRIKDILGTYEERLEPLREEKEKAEKFLKLSEELKLKDINIIIYNIENINEKLNILKNEIKKEEDILNKFINERNNLSKEAKNLNEELESFHKKDKKDREEYYSKKSKYKDIISEMNILQERISNSKNFIEKNSTELQEIQTHSGNLIKNKNSNEEKLKDLQLEQIEINKEIINLEKEIANKNSNISFEENKIKELKNKEIDILGKISDTKNENNLMENQIASLNKKLLEMQSALEGFSNSIEINEKTKISLKTEIENIKLNILKNEELSKKKKEKLKELRNEFKKKEKELNELKRKKEGLNTHKNILINLEKNYEGYSKAVKVIMNHIDKQFVSVDKDECFILGKVIRVDPKFNTAMDIALGSAVSNIITKDEFIAKKLIHYLKDNKLGRATFLPLSIIKGKKVQIKDNIKKAKGYIGIASEIINYKKEFSNAIDYVLGRTIIVDNIDNALNIAKMSNYSFKIVTLDGEVLNPGGALTGGSVFNKSSSSVIGRKEEIANMEIQEKNAERNIISLQSDIEKTLKNIEIIDNKELDIREEINNQNIKLAKIEEKVNSVNNEKNRLEKNVSVTLEEIKNIKNELKIKKEELNKNAKLKENLNKKRQENFNIINKLENEIITYKNFLYNKKEELVSLKIKKATIDENVNTYINELSRLNYEIEGLNNKNDKLKEEIKQSKNFIIESQDKIKINNENKCEIEYYINNMDDEFKNKEIEKIGIMDKIKKAESKLYNLNLEIENKEKSIHKREILLTKQETEKDNILNNLNEEYHITYAESLDYKLNEFDISKFKKDIKEIKLNISNLGTVNLGAIEEYKETKYKYDFMNSQKEDLTKAKDELNKVIEDMTKEMRSIFKDNFTKIRKIFNETFRELFQGGSADLVLGEGDELTADIDINVQPPGKKLQNISLMSGGEKVLSAIALLFSILKMKPTPFCILDEIEAALDDANVIRYSQFLKKFSDNIQFIVITHRKGTMEVSDRMYGVTMEEKGISKLVSLDLKDNI